MAHGILKAKLRQAGLNGQVHVDSAGTHVKQARYRPDPRARSVAMTHGINISRLKARQLVEEDFLRFDYILGMDSSNMAYISEICPDACLPKARKVTGAASNAVDVPDPYFGNQEGFDQVFELLDGVLTAFVDELKVRLTN